MIVNLKPARFISLLFLFAFKGFGQVVELDVLEIKCENTFFNGIIDNHLRNNIDSCVDVALVILPYHTVASGIPKFVIDSIYETNHFPNTDSNLAPYFFNVYSMCSFKYFGMQEKSSAFYYNYKNSRVLIWSSLKLNLDSDIVKKTTWMFEDGSSLHIPRKEDGTFYLVNSNFVIEIKQNIILEKYGRRLDWIEP